MKLLTMSLLIFSTQLLGNDTSCELPKILKNDDVITLRFPKNSSKFLPESEVSKTLSKIISAKNFIKKIEVHGHSSAKKLKNPKATLKQSRMHNLKLSQERADLIAKYLIEKGMSSEIVRSTAHGSERPLIKKYNAKAFATNRRVELKITTKKCESPVEITSLSNIKDDFEKVFPTQDIKIVNDKSVQETKTKKIIRKVSSEDNKICETGRFILPYPKGKSLIIPSESSKLIKKITKMKDQIKYISIEAHAAKEKLNDSRYTLNRSIKKNIEIAEERLEILKDTLSFKGFSSRKIRTINFGTDKPVAVNNSSNAHNQNRRMELIVKCL